MNSELKKTIKLEKSWLKELGPEFELSYMQELKLFLQREKKRGKKILPEGEDMFKALNLTPLDKVKVVILGQDPYHGAGQAHGLCFSVPEGVRIPPSLQNIFKELQSDLGLSIPSSGCLESWAEQGVLLLNSILSVEKGLANSHSSKGWELFTDSVISMVNEKKSIVFMLWGGYAAQKGKSIDSTRHLVLKSVHPSPLSAHRGFFGNRHFSKCNQFLESKSIRPIDWKVYKSVNT
jgi:uracil-DNA glycosylase